MPVQKTSIKSKSDRGTAAAKKAVAKKPAAKSDRPASLAPPKRTSAMLKDIRARGEELTADINDLLQRLA